MTSKMADKIKAINTVFFKEGKLFGASTDYYGFKKSLLETIPKFNFKDKKVLLLGAGGAAKSIIYGIMEEQIKSLKVLNRTIGKLDIIKDNLDDKVEIGGFDNFEENIQNADIIVNASSCGLNNKNNIHINYEKIRKKSVL